jgi:hypothetical protein
MNDNTDFFQLIPCALNLIVVETDRDYIVSIIADTIEYGIPLIGYDGTLLTFVDSKCSENAHINTIHQILLKFKESSGFTLKRIIIEAKFGDVIYCRLHWGHEIKDIYNIVGVGDALILYILSGCELFISKFVLDQFERFDTEGYMQSIDD